MDRQQLKEAMSKAEVETTDAVGPERRAFLNAAFLEHLGALGRSAGARQVWRTG